MATKTEYIPGVCNIGPAEIASRRRTGLVALIVTITLWGALFALKAPALVFAIVGLPAFVVATGLIQARLHFCAGFGAAGLYNFGREIGKTDTVQQAEWRAKDKKKAIQITAISALICVVVSVFAVITAP